MRGWLVVLIACSHPISATVDAVPPSDGLECRELDAGALDNDVVDAAICRCATCAEGEHLCVMPTLSTDGHVTAVIADPTAAPSDSQMACIAAQLVGQCLPSLAANVCAYGV